MNTVLMLTKEMHMHWWHARMHVGARGRDACFTTHRLDLCEVCWREELLLVDCAPGIRVHAPSIRAIHSEVVPADAAVIGGG